MLFRSSTNDTLSFFKDAYSTCSISYGDLKKQLAEDIIGFTGPFREEIVETSSNAAYLHKVVTEGAEKARENASKTVREVREIIGFKPF